MLRFFFLIKIILDILNFNISDGFLFNLCEQLKNNEN